MESGILIWIGFTMCLALSFVLSGMEAGVFALSRLRIRQQMRAGRRSARALHGYLENPENFLWTILVGNTAANFLILGWIVVVLHETLSARLPLFVIAFAGAVFLFYVFFDLLPKMVFRTYPNRLCIALARPFRIIYLVLRPLVAVVETVSGLLLRWRGGTVFTGHLFGNREEMRRVMQESAQAFSSEERAMINRVLDLQSLTVRQAMVPIQQVAGLEPRNTVQEVLALAREKNYTRLPVWETRQGQRRIVGLVNVNALLYTPNLDPARPVAEFIRPGLFLDEDLRLELALRRLQKTGERLAIVLGRDRREAGVITLQRILRVVFGEVSL